MTGKNIKGQLEFLREAERLKSVLRSSHTSTGRPESTAEHSWRLCLMAIAFESELATLDVLKILKMCIIHDLGEAINGDVPAVSKALHPEKSDNERRDLLQLTSALDNNQQDAIMALWQEYEDATSPEAKVVKALDKLETILQHTQGINPPDFDYEFNLSYGRKYTDADPFFSELRKIIDEDTKKRMNCNAP